LNGDGSYNQSMLIKTIPNAKELSNEELKKTAAELESTYEKLILPIGI